MWRSRGTQFWLEARRAPTCHAYFEPCYEQLAVAPRSVLEQRFAGRSPWFRHTPKGANVFEEFPEDATGRVPWCDERFSFEDHEAKQDLEAALRRYVLNLHAYGDARARVTMMKSCRWIALPAWLERVCGASVITLVRSPEAVFNSFWSFGGTASYFLAGMALWLSKRLANSSLVSARSELRLPQFKGHDVSEEVLMASRWCRQRDPQTLRDLLLVVWAAGVAYGHASHARQVDTDYLTLDAAYRREVAADLSALLDWEVVLESFAAGGAPPAPGAVLSDRGRRLAREVVSSIWTPQSFSNPFHGVTGELWAALV